MKKALLFIQLLILSIGFLLLYLYMFGGMGYTEERLPRGLRYFFSLMPLFIILKITTGAFLIYLYRKKESWKPLATSFALTLFCMLLPPAILAIPQPSQIDHIESLLHNSKYQQKWGLCNRGEKNGTCRFAIYISDTKHPIDFSALTPLLLKECEKINLQEEIESIPSLKKLVEDFPAILKSEATQCYKAHKHPQAQILKVLNYIFIYDETQGFQNENY